eukprot:TRINITY_DN12114_c0_g2_i2.p1 TRINITY_DN12114_c0_g2~~TRINITY_DN12114_c0_g2_i2.p1  ORF type:complete len:172 (-),score=24.29 TRINITY_DN12114_c0_g2_i2:113-628(-)
MANLFELFIFDGAGKLLYYEDIQRLLYHSSGKGVPRMGSQQSTLVFEGNEDERDFLNRVKNIFGICFTLRSLARTISPTPINSFRSFVTSKYKLSIFEALTGVKLILLSAPDDLDYGPLLGSLYSEAYVEFARKNPFYTLGEPIDCPAFQAKLRELFGSLLPSATANTSRP